jgi:hypothetical protein
LRKHPLGVPAASAGRRDLRRHRLLRIPLAWVLLGLGGVACW